MPDEILLAFRRPDEHGTREALVAGLLAAPGTIAARPFDVNVILGDRPPAFYPELVICEREQKPASAPPASLAWRASSIGKEARFDLPAHLYLQFSAQPPGMSFEAYSDWYELHQDENIAQTAALTRGWRFRLEPLAGVEAPGPTHLAAYEIEGTLATVTGDLGRAMQAGVISLPDWFTRFASLEAVAAGERVHG